MRFLLSGTFLRALYGSASLSLAGVALGTEIELVGVAAGRAVVVVNGGAPQTLRRDGRTREGVRLIEVSGDKATVVDIEGDTRILTLGAAPLRAGDRAPPASGTVSLSPDSRGHHFSDGSINSVPVRFLVDTGASMVSLGASDARRAGVDFRRGEAVMTQTANGPARVWKVRLDGVRVGSITLQGVDGLVHENDLPFVLLGMSFLNRMDMQRDGERLVLRRRY